MSTISEKYGFVAVSYAKELIKTKQSPSNDGWEKIARSVFTGNSLVEKGCPKGCFLGICEEGLITGIPKGKYTNSKKNKAYGISAITILRENDEYKNQPEELWKKIPGAPKTYNHQMHVVCALWKAGLINKNEQ
ncbi:MAG: hypothetical protein HDR32_08520 [Treponema sp.]|nr:hypothetical protein [Treponema sp.]